MRTSGIILLLTFVGCLSALAQQEKKCLAMLLTPNGDGVACGVYAYCERMKFEISGRPRSKGDTVMFVVNCPSDYAEGFWAINSVYHIRYKETAPHFVEQSNEHLTARDRKYRVMGVVTEVKKK